MTSRAILFVDDDVLTQWVMSEALSEHGYDVTSACRGSDACCLLDAQHGYDLLILDTDLPDLLTGPDLASAWHQASPNRPILFIGVERHALRRLGRHETFLSKPFTAEMLLAAVEFALEEAAYAQPNTSAPRVCHVH